jgi:hypothetical protein
LLLCFVGERQSCDFFSVSGVALANCLLALVDIVTQGMDGGVLKEFHHF